MAEERRRGCAANGSNPGKHCKVPVNLRLAGGSLFPAPVGLLHHRPDCGRLVHRRGRHFCHQQRQPGDADPHPDHHGHHHRRQHPYEPVLRQPGPGQPGKNQPHPLLLLRDRRGGDDGGGAGAQPAHPDRPPGPGAGGGHGLPHRLRPGPHPHLWVQCPVGHAPLRGQLPAAFLLRGSDGGGQHRAGLPVYGGLPLGRPGGGPGHGARPGGVRRRYRPLRLAAGAPAPAGAAAL